MADRNMKFNLDFLAKTKGLTDAKKSLDDVADGLDDVGDGLDDVESAAKQAADVMRQSAAKIDAELKETTDLADRLADSLGPEMAAKIGRSNLEGISSKLRDVGVSADASDADINTLADGLRELDRVAERAKGSLSKATNEVDDLGNATRRVGNEADNSRSVMANFAGNATQEIPGVTNAMGPLNMALGQFAEYATEGNIKFKNLVATGVGIGVAAIAMKALTDRAEALAKVKAFEDDAIRGYTESLKDAESRVAGIEEHLREVGKIELALGAGGGFFTGGVTKVIDMTAAFNALGLTASDTATLIDGGRPAIEAWTQAQIEGGVSAESMGLVTQALTTQVDLLAKSEARAAVTKAFLSKKTEEATPKLDLFSDAANEARIATDKAAAAVNNLGILLGTIDDDSALLNLQEQFDGVRQSAEDAWNAGVDAARAAEDAAKAVASGSEDAAEKSLAATEAAKLAEQATRAHELATNDLQISTANYGTEILKLPPERVTKMVSQIDNGSLDVVESRLAFLARNRNMYVFAGMIADSSLRNLMEGRGPHSAAGRTGFSGTTEINEAGPELIRQNGRMYATGDNMDIINAAESGRMMQSGTGGGPSLTVNAYGITDVAALARLTSTEMAWLMKTRGA